MIIRTSAGHLYRVNEPTDPDLAHCWMGREVRRLSSAKGRRAAGTTYQIRFPLRAPELVRKAASTIITLDE